jgi:tetratricopeptide (TPR) repeat protein
MPARYAIERRDWKLATSLEPHPTKFSFPEAMTHYARGLGFAHLGSIDAAQNESDRLQELRDALWSNKDTYWANQVEVQRISVDAWIAAAQGNREEAMKRMRSAADLEDSMEKHIVTPGPVAPARQLLGDMLLEYGNNEAALAAYQAAAAREPGRRRTAEGMARAKTLLGQR